MPYRTDFSDFASWAKVTCGIDFTQILRSGVDITCYTGLTLILTFLSEIACNMDLTVFCSFTKCFEFAHNKNDDK